MLERSRKNEFTIMYNKGYNIYNQYIKLAVSVMAKCTEVFLDDLPQ